MNSPSRRILVKLMPQAVKEKTKVTKSFIRTCLGNGLTDSQIAEQLGVSASAVTQVIDKYGLRDAAAENETFATIDALYNKAELQAIKQLNRVIGSVLDPMKLTKVIQTINSAKRRSMVNGDGTGDTNVQFVQINLPAHVEAKVVVNAKNQVAEVDGRPLVTMPSGKLLKEIDNNGTEQLEHNPQSPLPKDVL